MRTGLRAQRVAFFGGTFDPPHLGHLAVAQAAAARFALDQVLLAPVGVQPLKSEPPAASYADRLAMTRLLCEHQPGEAAAPLAASELDAPLTTGEPNYTVDALRRLRELLPANTALYAIAGADAFLTLQSWRDPAGLLALADWIVVTRPGFTLDSLAPLRLSAQQRAKVHVLDDVEVPVSATGVRARLRTGDPCADALTPAVSAYIAQHRLYC